MRGLAGRPLANQLLSGLDLLGAQNHLHKTYPSNSSHRPIGYESRAILEKRSNRMTARGAARLLLALREGWIEPQSTSEIGLLLVRTGAGQEAYG